MAARGYPLTKREQKIERFYVLMLLAASKHHEDMMRKYKAEIARLKKGRA